MYRKVFSAKWSVRHFKLKVEECYLRMPVVRTRILIYLWVLAGLAFHQAIVAEDHKNRQMLLVDFHFFYPAIEDRHD